MPSAVSRPISRSAKSLTRPTCWCPPSCRKTSSSANPHPTSCSDFIGGAPARVTLGSMRLPVMPPVAPMLAKAVKEIPGGAMSFEPKWDGFRSIIFRDGDEVEIGSRNERPMTRYFPELVEAVRENMPERCVVDGEIIVIGSSGDRLDFEVLQQRIHPAASRVKLLSVQTPARFVAFDLLAVYDTDYTKRPFAERRAALVDTLAAADPPIHVTAATTDVAVARQWFHQFEGAGLDGIIAKPLGGLYEPDKRTMFKVKHERTADCVVAGYRLHKSGPDRIAAARSLQRRRHIGQRGRDRRVPDGAPQGAVRTDAAAGHHLRRAPVGMGQAAGGYPDATQRRNQPVGRGQGPVLHPTAARVRRRGPLRPHGRRPVPAHRPVRPLAPRP